jgi:hypothetical protein
MATGSLRDCQSLGKKITGSPDGIRRFNAQYRQNVAVLWLKCGVKSLKIETFRARKILWGDATIF